MKIIFEKEYLHFELICQTIGFIHNFSKCGRPPWEGASQNPEKADVICGQRSCLVDGVNFRDTYFFTNYT